MAKSEPIDGDRKIKELMIEILREERPGSVGELVGALVERAEREISITEAIKLVKELEEEGRIRLSEPLRAHGNFSSYLSDRESSLSFWLVVCAVAMTWASIYALPSEFPWVVSRWVFGSLFVIFLPGYAFVEALFVEPISGKKELDQIERFALSIGMSLALVPLAGLLLNYTPWGIRLEPIAVSLSSFTLLCATVAAYRKYAKLSAEVGRAIEQGNAA
ncbi:MAG: DUF1616 domain-containing protein [Thermoproteota archaeon]